MSSNNSNNTHSSMSSNNSINTNSSHPLTSSQTSYAAKTKTKIAPLTNFVHPNDNQGIVFNTIQDYKLRDYLLAIKDLVGGPLSIIAASKVSKNRVIIFLKSEDLVNTFMTQHGGFSIHSNFIACRRLKSPTKRLVFSNVSPTIPNEILEQYIVNDLKIKLLSGISILRVNPTDDLFGHIVAFRRQVYTNGDIDTATLPGSFELIHDDRAHRIFITFDEFTCFKCKSKGHRAEDCPSISDDFIQNDNHSSELPPLNPSAISENDAASNSSTHLQETPTSADNSETDHSDYDSVDSENEQSALSNKAHQESTDFDREFPPIRSNEQMKRPLSTASTSDLSALSHRRPPKKKPKSKRTKHSQTSSEDDAGQESQGENMEVDHPSENNDSLTLKETFAPLEENMKKFADRYPITLTNLSLFVDMVKDNKQAVIIAKDFTNDLKGLHTTLKENYKFLTNRKMKTKFTKILNQLEAEFASSAKN